ncbi:hypothetical protein [Nostoc sp. FACHB-133]|uniref:hypothetical protein n=1 Tax=Nostoc sp. FACHB-133 TaxID=2692835 RepID=UPI001687577F|nr:hypothetical protein [Nostoc sp. FACHB-133]MBD2527026.1 hypothetical protein [Nostoc sp. FACHB-133]
MKKNSEVRIQESEWAKRPATANRSQNEDARSSLPLRYQWGIQTRHGIVAPLNQRFSGGLKPLDSDALYETLKANADSLRLRYPPVAQNTQLNSGS